MNIERITESNFQDQNLINHVDKHYSEFIDDPRFAGIDDMNEFMKKYDEIANSVSRHKVSKSNSHDRFVGFIAEDGRRIKYDRKYRDFVVYNFNQTITFHKKSEAEYRSILARDFYKEFPYNR